jgi:hypothetical protein
MPYELSFTKPLPPLNREDYINECCVGGDIVVDHLLPSVRAKYTDIQSNQEDWGWFIWFRKGSVGLAIDVFTEDSERGEFRVHLTSSTKRLLVLNNIIDTTELEELRTLVVTELESWTGNPIKTTHLDRNYM